MAQLHLLAPFFWPVAAGGGTLMLTGGKAASGDGALVLFCKAAPGGAVLGGTRTGAGLRLVVAAAGLDDLSGEDPKPKVFSAERIKKMGAPGANGGAVLAGTRTGAGLHLVVAAAGGLGDFFGEDSVPKVTWESWDDLIQKLAKETSYLLRDVRAPTGCSFPELSSFSVETGALREMCDQIGSGGFDGDLAMCTLLGIQSRVRLLLGACARDEIRGSPESLDALLLSSMYSTKITVSQFMGGAAGGFSGEDLNAPKVTGAELIQKLAHDTSILLRDVCAQEDWTPYVKASFSRELGGLRDMCGDMSQEVGRGGLDEDVAISALIGLQARVRILLFCFLECFPESQESLEGLLLSSTYRTKVTITQYMTAAAGGDGDAATE